MPLLKLSILFLLQRGEQTKLGAGPPCCTLVGSSENPSPRQDCRSIQCPAAALQRGVPTLDLQALKSWCHQPRESRLESPRAARLPGRAVAAWVRTGRLLAACPRSTDPSFRLLLSLGKFAISSCLWLVLVQTEPSRFTPVAPGGSDRLLHRRNN